MAATGSCCPDRPAGTLLVRPLGGRDDETTVLLPELDKPAPAVFDAPSVDDRGDAARARLLRDALRLSFRATAGPFRSFAQLSVSPRNYQLVPLMMATSQDTTRLLIADGVGIGKTIEAGLIAAELLACGDAQRLAVLCSPQLAPQWQSELRTKFGINAEVLLPSTANRLARSVPFGSTVYEHYPYLIVSTDYVKQRSRRDEFALLCPELVIVDEAHTCIAPSSAIGSSQAHQRYTLLRRLADDQTRHLLLLTATPHNGDDGAWQSLVGLLDDRLGELPSDLSGADREDDRKLLARFLIQRQRADIREYLSEDTPFPSQGNRRGELQTHPGIPQALRPRPRLRPRTGHRPLAEPRTPPRPLVVGDRAAPLNRLQPCGCRADPAQPIRPQGRREHGGR